jgi:NADH-quinone oxidoreductase subunit N
MAAYVSTETLRVLLPETVLVAAASAIYVGGAFSRAKAAWSWLAGAGLLVAACFLWSPADMVGEDAASEALLAGGPFQPDGLAMFVRWLMLLLGGLFVLLSAKGAASGQAPEQVGSLLLVVAGAMLVSGASELVLLFLGLELISIPTYVLLYLGRRDVHSQEAAAKYFYLSILSSAVMLYGFSFLYGLAGSTQLSDIRAALMSRAMSSDTWLPLVGVGLVLVLAGLGFKIAAVPFHFYAPDVYQGTTHTNAALLAIVPKIAGITALARVAALFAGGDSFNLGWVLVLALATATMTLGNVLGLWQDNLRRLLAYSSIAHSGYLLIGLAVGFAANLDGVTIGVDGLESMLFYIAVYAFGTLGAFAALEHLGDDKTRIDEIGQLSGLGRIRPVIALAIAVFMFSLAGIPPLAGFLGKLTLFFSAVGVQSADNSRLTTSFIVLAIVGAINAAIAAAYYLRVVGVMYFGSPGTRPSAARGGRGALVVTAASAALVVGIGLFPTSLLNGAHSAAQAARRIPAENRAAAREADSPAMRISGRRR